MKQYVTLGLKCSSRAVPNNRILSQCVVKISYYISCTASPLFRRFKSNIGARSISVAAPILWNSLLDDM